MARQGKAVQFYMDEAQRDALKELAESNGRTLTEELTRAVGAWLANPERVVRQPAAAPGPEAPTEKRKRGRPKGSGKAPPAE